MLWYVPLEGYKERYTMQWSAPKTGWLERNWIKAGVEYTRVDPMEGSRLPPSPIKVGSVVDAVGRSQYCFMQITKLLDLANEGKIKDNDVIFLDDFWTPGLEALPYAFHLLGIRPRVYAFLHAQSVDEFDFTHPMREWMRPIETGFANFLDGIFVCCPTLEDLVCLGGISNRNKVHVTGHPFSSEEVMERMPSLYRMNLTGYQSQDSAITHAMKFSSERKNQVVWSSRWDEEKNPDFFLKVAEDVIRNTYCDARFIVCTSAPKLRSNNRTLLKALAVYTEQFPDRIILKEGLSKEEYYATLCESKIQFNCANQDFVAITLLEASVAGCYPIYPYFRSFPETFLWNKGVRYMYPHLDLKAASAMICDVCSQKDLWTAEKIKERSWIHSRYDTAWLRMLHVMDVPVMDATDSEWDAQKDPYDKGDW